MVGALSGTPWNYSFIYSTFMPPFMTPGSPQDRSENKGNANATQFYEQSNNKNIIIYVRDHSKEWTYNQMEIKRERETVQGSAGDTLE